MPQRERGQALVVQTLRFLVGKHHLEQWRPARIGIPLEAIDEQAEGKVLMFQALGDGPAHAVQELVERRVAREVAPHRQHVDEVADQPFETRTGPSRDRGADDDVVLAG